MGVNCLCVLSELHSSLYTSVSQQDFSKQYVTSQQLLLFLSSMPNMQQNTFLMGKLGIKLILSLIVQASNVCIIQHHCFRGEITLAAVEDFNHAASFSCFQLCPVLLNISFDLFCIDNLINLQRSEKSAVEIKQSPLCVTMCITFCNNPQLCS